MFMNQDTKAETIKIALIGTKFEAKFPAFGIEEDSQS
jgi:hypothetical protein